MTDFGYIIASTSKNVAVGVKQGVGTQVLSILLILDYDGEWTVSSQLIPTMILQYPGVYFNRTFTFVEFSDTEIMLGVSTTCAAFATPNLIFSCDEGLVYIFSQGSTGEWFQTSLLPLQIYFSAISDANLLVNQELPQFITESSLTAINSVFMTDFQTPSKTAQLIVRRELWICLCK